MNHETPPTDAEVSEATRQKIIARREELESLADSELPAAPIADALLEVAK